MFENNQTILSPVVKRKRNLDENYVHFYEQSLITGSPSIAILKDEKGVRFDAVPLS